MSWTKSEGVGGKLLSDGDFVVEEIPLKKFLVKYSRSSSGVTAMNGKYFLYRLSKRGMTTADALKYLDSKFSPGDIGYAGLKDKHAVTTQYITLKKDIGSFSGAVKLEKIGTTNNMMQIGELEGNRFIITLHGCNVEKIADVVVELENNGLPNYFGPQRFSNNNSEIGLLLLQRKYDEALEMIRKSTRRNIASLEQVGKNALKFYIHSYQSSLFNTVLDTYISCNTGPFFDKFPIAGNDSVLDGFAGKETKKLLKADGVSLESFEFKDLQLRCMGSLRDAFVKVKIDYDIQGDNIIMRFDLPPGSYATVLIGEVTKGEYL